jgi:hypothetical protein
MAAAKKKTAASPTRSPSITSDSPLRREGADAAAPGARAGSKGKHLHLTHLFDVPREDEVLRFEPGLYVIGKKITAEEADEAVERGIGVRMTSADAEELAADDEDEGDAGGDRSGAET